MTPNKSCPVDTTLFWVVFSAIALVMLLLCGGAGTRHNAGMRAAPVTPYTQPTVSSELQKLALPALAQLKHDVTQARLRVLLVPACPEKAEALDIADSILNEAIAIESSIRRGTATDADIAQFGEKIKRHNAQSEALSARLRALDK